MSNLARIQQALASLEADGIMITSPENRFFATGFQSSAGMCIITQNSAVFATDCRYLARAREQVTGFEVQDIGRRTYREFAAQTCQELGISSLAFESDTMPFDQHAEYATLEAALVPAGQFFLNLRRTKQDFELDRIIKAQRIAQAAFEQLLAEIKPGMTEQQLAARLIYLLYNNGSQGLSFEVIALSGPNTANPHGVPGERKLQDGDFILLDFGAVYAGYRSDMTRTFCLGQPTEKMRGVYNIVLKAQQAAIEKSVQGVALKDIDAAARKVIEEAGYGEYFGHGTGHGVGIEIHELPNVNTKSDKSFDPGDCITIEPGIYLDDEFGVRIEDMLFYSEQGVINLTTSPKELIIV